jgi:tight adherence protein B
MTTLFEYLIYVAAFIAVVLAVEGGARLIRSSLGEEREVKRRLGKARAHSHAAIKPEDRPGHDPVSLALTQRLPWLAQALVRADARFSVLQLLIATVVLFVMLLTLLGLAHAPRLIALAGATAVAVGAPILVVTSLINGRRKRFLDQLPQAVDLIARSLQAGHPVTTAMSVVGERMPAPLGPEFRLVIEEMTYGLDRDVALDNLVGRFPLPELRMFTACLEVTRESGGNLAEVFLKLAEAIRAKDQLRRKVHAISAEGRMTFWVVSGLPFIVGSAILLIRPEFFAAVANDKLFWPMMSTAPVTLAIGSTMIWRMVNFKI